MGIVLDCKNRNPGYGMMCVLCNKCNRFKKPKKNKKELNHETNLNNVRHDTTGV